MQQEKKMHACKVRLSLRFTGIHRESRRSEEKIMKGQGKTTFVCTKHWNQQLNVYLIVTEMSQSHKLNKKG